MMPRTLAILLAVAAVARADMPATEKHPFAVPPLEVLDRLAKADLGPIPVPTAADRAFLETVWAARSKPAADRTPPTADVPLRALLLPSGVSPPAEREKSGRQLEALTPQARKAVGAAGSPREKADKLLRFLHAEPMKNGYEGDQSSLPAVLD